MAENVRPPVAIRIVRPYDSEDELLEHELETIGKTSVVLIGAHPRPTGVILRFEVTLASGNTVLRGEGRVLAHKENAFRGQPGLTLRFTRLDPRSKAVVDRATAMREAKSQGEGGSPSRPAPSPSRPDAALENALTASTPAPAPTTAARQQPQEAQETQEAQEAQEDAPRSARERAREKANATARTNAKRTGRAAPMALTPPPVPVDDRPTPEPTPVTSIPGEVAVSHVETPEQPRPEMRTTAPPATAPTISAPPLARQPRASTASTVTTATRVSGAVATSPSPIEPPPDREALLARLRDRAAKLPPDRVAEILAARTT